MPIAGTARHSQHFSPFKNWGTALKHQGLAGIDRKGAKLPFGSIRLNFGQRRFADEVIFVKGDTEAKARVERALLGRQLRSPVGIAFFQMQG